MKHCPECRIMVGGTGSHCPLCGHDLIPADNSEGETDLYPDFSQPEKPRSGFPFLAKLFAFISMIIIFLCGTVDLLITHHLTWSLYVIGAIAAVWISVGTHLLTNINLNYKLMVDLCALSLYLVLIDKLSGWAKWSINYVVPILYIGIMITTVILALVFREFWREYILTLIAVCVLGIVPLIIFFTSESPMRFLCLAAALSAVILLTGVLFFAGGKFFSEWKRRMNL